MTKGLLLELLMIMLAGEVSGARNLIVNPAFEAGNSGFSSDYIFSPADMTPAGVYCITNNPAATHAKWRQLGDHTTGTGLMMIVNGSTEGATDVVWRQSVAVDPYREYLFSAWAINVTINPFSHPPGTFCFYVNGVQLYPSIPIPAEAVWQNYSTIWTSGSSTNATLEIRSISEHYSGNDFAFDDLYFYRLGDVHVVHSQIATAVEISWRSETNSLYQVQWTDSLVTNIWFALGSPVPGNGRTNSVFDTTRDRPKQFYRVMIMD